MIFDERRSELGEGPFWHPKREALFWFDILKQKLLTRDAQGPQEWYFSDMVSAAGWIDHSSLLIASTSGLIVFDLEHKTQRLLCGFEGDPPHNRPNDGRTDPQNGFWIGTMSQSHAQNAGAIYRYYRGTLRKLFSGLTIPNTICFSPDGQSAYFSDTPSGHVMRVALDTQGWPKGKPEVYLDLKPLGLNPDGAVIDTAGMMWLAQWGASRVAAYGPDGAFVKAISFDAPNVSCPAFGGDNLRTLYCTSAQEGMAPDARARTPHAGKVFAQANVALGQISPRVIL